MGDASVPPDLGTLLSRVNDQYSFAAFVEALRREIALAARDPEDPMGRIELDAYLGAIRQWAESPLASASIDDTNPWQAAAKLLVAGYAND